MNVIERLLDKTVDLDQAQTPQWVQVEGRKRAVVASAYLPPREGCLPAHVVVYNREHGAAFPISPDDLGWAVSILVQAGQDDSFLDPKRSYLAHGDYDLTFARAMALFVRRIETQG
jgi:hypothetical protein